MEDEDEIKHSIEQPSMAEPHQKEEPQGSDQCGTILTDVESFSPDKTTLENVEESKFEQFLGFDEEGRGEEGGANVEESKSEGVEDGIGGEEEVEVKEGMGKKEGKTVEESEMEENKTVGDDDMIMDALDVKDETRMNEGENAEELKLEDSKMEEKTTVGDDGMDMDEGNVGGLLLEGSEVEENATVCCIEGHIEGENVKESKSEDSKMEEKVSVGDDGMDMDEVAEEGIKEVGNVEGSKFEDSKIEVEDGLIKEEGVIEGESRIIAVDEQSLEVNVNEVENKEEEEEERRGEDMEDLEATADEEATPQSPVVEEDAEVSNEEQLPIADTEIETESEVAKSGSGSGGKRRRGRIPKASAPVKASSRKTVGEDVCFICLHGGDLVLCDRRSVLFPLHTINTDMDLDVNVC